MMCMRRTEVYAEGSLKNCNTKKMLEELKGKIGSEDAYKTYNGRRK